MTEWRVKGMAWHRGRVFIHSCCGFEPRRMKPWETLNPSRSEKNHPVGFQLKIDGAFWHLITLITVTTTSVKLLKLLKGYLPKGDILLYLHKFIRFVHGQKILKWHFPQKKTSLTLRHLLCIWKKLLFCSIVVFLSKFFFEVERKSLKLGMHKNH